MISEELSRRGNGRFQFDRYKIAVNGIEIVSV
jgi:hypothetical protein